MSATEPVTANPVNRLEKLEQRAETLFLSGYNCAQTVLLCCQELIEMQDENVFRSATGFGGGIGNLSDVCGALSGGVIAIGQKFGRVGLSWEEVEKKERTYRLAAEFYKGFQEGSGSAHCRDIVGVDISDPVIRKTYWTEGNRRKCLEGPVTIALRLLYSMFEREAALPNEE